jgi:hypothetical protein
VRSLKRALLPAVAPFQDDRAGCLTTPAFGADNPHPDAPMPGVVDMFLASNLTDSTKRKILWDNASRLYGSRVVWKNGLAGAR